MAFRWGGTNIYGTPATFAAGAAYATATDGIVVDFETCEILVPQRAVEVAREIEKQMPLLEAELRRLDPDGARQ